MTVCGGVCSLLSDRAMLTRTNMHSFVVGARAHTKGYLHTARRAQMADGQREKAEVARAELFPEE